MTNQIETRGSTEKVLESDVAKAMFNILKAGRQALGQGYVVLPPAESNWVTLERIEVPVEKRRLGNTCNGLFGYCGIWFRFCRLGSKKGGGATP